MLAFGQTLSDRYRRLGWGRRAFTWHEAADTRRFHPIPTPDRRGLVWIGNWGDGERERELGEFLVEPATALGLVAHHFQGLDGLRGVLEDRGVTA